MSTLVLSQDEYQQYDAIGLADLVARRQINCVELLEVAIARALAVQPKINALVTPLYEQARQQARLMDARLVNENGYQQPFAGVPFLVKDLFQDIAGIPTSGGSRALSKMPITEHSDVVKRWINAGLIIFGKTNTPEFGSKNVTESTYWGPARNPWDLTRTTGGSSGGSAAAVAAGVVPVAGANDGGGSIRIPAAACGLFGFKAGRGRISIGPMFAEGMSDAAVQGVVSRSVRDTAAMLDILQGPEAHAPYYMSAPAPSYLSGLAQPIGRLRVGYSSDSPMGTPVSPEAVAAVQDAASLLQSLGHQVEPAAPQFDGQAFADDFFTAWCCQIAMLSRFLIENFGARSSDFEPDTQVMACIGRSISGVEYLDAERRWNDYIHAVTDFHARYDLWLCPTLSATAPRIGQLALGKLDRLLAQLGSSLGLGRLLRRSPQVLEAVRTSLTWTPYTQLANLTGRPSMSVPLHWSAEGLPLGVQLSAGLNGEMQLLRLAAQLEQARPWAAKRPTL